MRIQPAASTPGPFRAARAVASSPGPAPIPLIHVTDLFRPRVDPDDHYDLATVFALARRGAIDLRAVLIDGPPRGLRRDPDVLAVAQLNRLAGLAVPVLTGSSRRLEADEALRPESRSESAGARMLLETLRRAERPAAITVVGSTRDVALAGRLDPALFAAKVAAVYLNAGSGTRDAALAARLEYNVSLDPRSYAEIFALPCPVVWLPCFDVAPGAPGPESQAGPFGTFYWFRQKDVLPRLSPRLRNYFMYMFREGEAAGGGGPDGGGAPSPGWLRALEGEEDPASTERAGRGDRRMWCTAGFLHAAGMTVTPGGDIVPAGGPGPALYTFDPIRVRCGAGGVTEWSPDPASRSRFIFHVRDADRYPAAMTEALAALLAALD